MRFSCQTTGRQNSSFRPLCQMFQKMQSYRQTPSIRSVRFFVAISAGLFFLHHVQKVYNGTSAGLFHEDKANRSAEKVDPPGNNVAFSKMMLDAAPKNETLLNYCYPSSSHLSTDPLQNWVPLTPGCEVAHDCYCFHVSGDMSRSRILMATKHALRSQPSLTVVITLSSTKIATACIL